MYPDHAFGIMDNWTSIKSSIIEFGIQHCSVLKKALQLTCSDYATLSEGSIYTITYSTLDQRARNDLSGVTIEEWVGWVWGLGVPPKGDFLGR